MKEKIEKIIMTLPPEEQELLKCRFSDNLTQEETALYLNVERKLIVEMENAIFKKIKKLQNND